MQHQHIVEYNWYPEVQDLFHVHRNVAKLTELYFERVSLVLTFSKGISLILYAQYNVFDGYCYLTTSLQVSDSYTDIQTVT